MAASNVRLGLLHSQVAEVMAEMLKPRSIPVMGKDEDGNEIEIGARVEYPSPATVAVAVKFLKDNSISADIENDVALTDLKDALSKARHAHRVPTDRDMKDALAEVGKGLMN